MFKNSRVKNLTKDLLLFSIASFIPKVLGFFLLPLYTSLLTTSEYGTYDLLTTIASLILPILSLDISDAVLVFTLELKNDEKKKEYPLEIAKKIIVFSAVFLFAVLVIAYFVLKQYYSISYYIYIFTYYLSTVILNCLVSYLRAVDNVKLVVFSGLANSVVTICANVFLIIVFSLGLDGLLIANIAGNIIGILFIIPRTKTIKIFNNNIYYRENDSNLLKKMIKYSFPLIFTGLAWWINSYSDRLFISYYLGLSDNGLYAVANKIPSILTAFHAVGYQAIRMSVYRENSSNDTKIFQVKMYKTYSAMMLVTCSIVICFNNLIAKFLFQAEFFVAWKYAPALLISIAIFSISGVLTPMYEVEKKSSIIAKSTILGATINTLLNYILIPMLGLYGAVISTIAGYLFVWIGMVIRLKNIGVRTNHLSIILGIVVLIAQWIMLLKGTGIFAQLLLVCCLLLINVKYFLKLMKLNIRRIEK